MIADAGDWIVAGLLAVVVLGVGSQWIVTRLRERSARVARERQERARELRSVCGLCGAVGDYSHACLVQGGTIRARPTRKRSKRIRRYDPWIYQGIIRVAGTTVWRCSHQSHDYELAATVCRRRPNTDPLTTLEN